MDPSPQFQAKVPDPDLSTFPQARRQTSIQAFADSRDENQEPDSHIAQQYPLPIEFTTEHLNNRPLSLGDESASDLATHSVPPMPTNVPSDIEAVSASPDRGSKVAQKSDVGPGYAAAEPADTHKVEKELAEFVSDTSTGIGTAGGDEKPPPTGQQNLIGDKGPASWRLQSGLIAGVFVAGFITGVAFWWLTSTYLLTKPPVPPMLARDISESITEPFVASTPDPEPTLALEPEKSTEAAAIQPSEKVIEPGEALPASALLAQGPFVAPEFGDPVAGTAELVRDESGTTSLQLIDFFVSDGPGLHVLLVAGGNIADSDDVLAADWYSLGPLSMLSGDHEYKVPEIENFADDVSVVIWSQPFGIIFASARLVSENLPASKISTEVAEP